jgi:hypothetical protein
MEHPPIAQAPDVKEKQDGFLEGIAPYLGRLAATWTIVTLVVRATGSTLMLFLGERCHLVRLPFPLLELLVSILQIPHW